MHWLDIVLIIALVLPALIGLKRGLISSAFLLVGLIIGIVLAGYLYELLSRLLTFIPNENVANVVAFIIIVVGVVVIVTVLSRLLKFTISAVMLGWVDRLGGAVFGLVVGAILLSALLAICVNFFVVESVTESFLAVVLLDKFPLILSLLPSEFDAIRDFFQ